VLEMKTFNELLDLPDAKANMLKIELAEQIFNAMKARRITQTQISNLMGCSCRQYINRVLKGNMNCTVEMLNRIAMALNAEVQITFLLKPETEEYSQRLHSATKIKKPNAKQQKEANNE